MSMSCVKPRALGLTQTNELKTTYFVVLIGDLGDPSSEE